MWHFSFGMTYWTRGKGSLNISRSALYIVTFNKDFNKARELLHRPNTYFAFRSSLLVAFRFAVLPARACRVAGIRRTKLARTRDKIACSPSETSTSPGRLDKLAPATDEFHRKPGSRRLKFQEDTIRAQTTYVPPSAPPIHKGGSTGMHGKVPVAPTDWTRLHRSLLIPQQLYLSVGCQETLSGPDFSPGLLRFSPSVPAAARSKYHVIKKFGWRATSSTPLLTLESSTPADGFM